MSDSEPWTCDTCHKPLLPGEARYAIADKPEERTGRHWDCHVPTEKLFEDLNRSLDRVRMTAKKVQDHLDRRRR